MFSSVAEKVIGPVCVLAVSRPNGGSTIRVTPGPKWADMRTSNGPSLASVRPATIRPSHAPVRPIRIATAHRAIPCRRARVRGVNLTTLATT